MSHVWRGLVLLMVGWGLAAMALWLTSPHALYPFGEPSRRGRAALHSSSVQGVPQVSHSQPRNP